jgi:transcriptional regulator with XRE-family HTH domain
MKFGDKVKDLRLRRNMKQDELAKALGVNVRTIAFYEKGEKYPRKRENYYKLAEIFGVEPNYILTEDEEFITEARDKYGKKGQTQALDVLNRASALFAGGGLSDADQLAFIHEIQRLYFDSKERAREKFTPKRYRKNGRVSWPAGV